MRRTPPAALAVATTSLAAALAVAVSAHAPAHGVRNGSVDGDQHPMVGVMVAQDELGNPMWDCSGTLVSPRVFVTAGHCTTDDHGVEAADVQVWFGAGPIDVDQRYVTDPDDRWCEDGSGLRYGFPCEGEAGALEVHTHPEYEPSEFWRHDLGVVVLDEGVELPEGYDYATLPEPGQFDGWRSNRKQTFDAVGYGRQHDYGQGAAGRESANLTERRLAHPRLVSINKPSVG